MTAATQPSIEDIVRGGLPWIPKVNFLNLFLAYENGDDFLSRFHLAAKRHRRKLHTGRRGIDPRRNQQSRRLLGVFRNGSGDRATDHHLRMDRPVCSQRVGNYGGRHMRHLRRNPCHGR
jgi:hypothetical protein